MGTGSSSPSHSSAKIAPSDPPSPAVPASPASRRYSPPDREAHAEFTLALTPTRSAAALNVWRLQLAKKDERIAELEALVAQKDKLNARKNAEVVDLQSQVAKLQKQLRELTAVRARKDNPIPAAALKPVAA